jgi:ABC-2 type transport system ATP-binding protein
MLVTVNSLRKSFEDKTVLNGLTFSIAQGEIYGLLGPNGSGKTTTINILCNLLDADSGTIEIGREPIAEHTKYMIGIAPQEISVYKDLTCEENLKFFAQIYGLERSQRIKRTEELIETFQLNEYAQTTVSNLSGGWQRRINIAVALVHSPSMLILDEPTAGLDIEARYDLWRLIDNLKNMDVTILLTTHYLEEAERLCSRIGILQHGHIVAEGSLKELCQKIPATQLAIIVTEEENAARQKAASIGWEYRYYGDKLFFWLPEYHTINEIVNVFNGIPLSSITLQKVGLEHVYLELTNKGRGSVTT